MASDGFLGNRELVGDDLVGVTGGDAREDLQLPLGERLGVAGASRLRDIFAHVASQNFVDEGLVPDAAATCFLAELIEHSRIDSNRDQQARFVAERRPTDAPHGLQLRRG
jgi:hypothetical protein